METGLVNEISRLAEKQIIGDHTGEQFKEHPGTRIFLHCKHHAHEPSQLGAGSGMMRERWISVGSGVELAASESF